MSYEATSSSYESDPTVLVRGVCGAFDQVLGDRDTRTLMDLRPRPFGEDRLLTADELPSLDYVVLSRDPSGSFYRREHYIPGGPRSSGRPGMYGVVTLRMHGGHFLDYDAAMHDYFEDDAEQALANAVTSTLAGLGAVSLGGADSVPTVDAGIVGLNHEFPTEALNSLRILVEKLNHPQVYDRERVQAIAPHVPIGEDIRAFLG